MSGRERDRDLATLGSTEDTEPVRAGRVRDGQRSGHLTLERQIHRLPVREATSRFVEPDHPKPSAQAVDHVAEPGRGVHHPEVRHPSRIHQKSRPGARGAYAIRPAADPQ
jgi:hypothetical protein